MKQIFVGTILILFFIGCSNLEVHIDAKKDYNFVPWLKFDIEYIKKGDSDDFYRNRVEILLRDYFTNKGYLSSDRENADFYIRFQLNIETKTIKMQETRAQRPIIYLRRVGTAPLSLSDTCSSIDLNKLMLSRLALAEYIKPVDTVISTSTHEYQYAKLFIELVDAKTKNIIWQGLVEDDLSYISGHKGIKEIIKKLFNDFPKK